MSVLPDPGASRAVLVGTGRYEHLEQLPAVTNNLRAFADLLRGPLSLQLPAQHVTVVENPHRTARTACPVRRAVHNRHPNTAGPTTAPAARHRACATTASRPVLIFGSSTVNPGSARASTSGPIPHSSASTPRPASLRTTSASARTPPPSCRTGELRHVHSRSTPAAGRL
ncbi:hypothetical protein [Streptomyces sp. NRRL S-1022]|uniref:hypothetical protein n=1 Tax=Streptomyces sp. NRRL S-1022 TaxID=1463880 RepID=UPI00099DEDE8|nr:hypothetical protein [Streptomyces sp. NRRL S-1022]